MIDKVMKLHPCSSCSIRCRAKAKPQSVFARIHHWHMAWWPGWKIYQTELRTHNVKSAQSA